MSVDRKLDQVCTHEVLEEALFLSPDRVTVRPLRPISNVQSVRVRVNGEVMVKPTGLQIPALAKGSVPGPYNIQLGVNDTLVIRVDNRAPQTVTLASGRGITAHALAHNLTTSVSGATFSTTQLQQIEGRSYTLGPASKITYLSGSTAAATLGLTLGRVYQGQDIFPSWSLIIDPNTVSARPFRQVVFDAPIGGTNDFFELSYTTLRQECRRCGGSGVENDWRYTGQGQVLMVRDGDLLIQELLKITYTVKGSNPFHTWYGTGLLESIGKKVTDRNITQNLILSDVQEAFRRWQNIKKQQEENVGQFVSDEEYPFRLLAVNLKQDTEDPTIVYVDSIVQSRSARPIQVSRGLKLPVPLDILGSTVQDALLRQV